MTKKPRPSTPPRWATRLLEWYCRPSLLEDLQGDLNEYFSRNVTERGQCRARFIYIVDVIKFFRPYTIRKPEFLNLLIHFLMLNSYIKTSARNLTRNTLFSFINISGLAISMSVGLLLIGMLSDLYSYDNFHEKGDRIYRVKSNYQYLETADRNYYASTSLKAGVDIKSSLSGIEEVTMLRSGLEADATSKEKTVPLTGMWADENFFRVFTFNLVEGDPATALRDPFSVVLTTTAAAKLFRDGSALGQRITLQEKDYTITGILEDVPKFSHLRFEMLASLSTRAITEKERLDRELAWDNMWQTYVYVVLPENADLDNLQQNLDRLSAENDKTVKNTKIRLALQPLSEIALGEDLNNSIGPVMGSSEVRMIGILTFVVILSACFNYTNLSVARSLRRSREVGIRKVVGALKTHVFAQFVVEALLISLLALVVAFGLFMALKQPFLNFQPKLQEMLELDLSFPMIIGFILLAIVTGIAAGLFPSWLFSRINPTQVLKQNSSLRLFRNLSLRKSLIVVQYCISLMLIAVTVIGFNQYKFLLNFDLGYNTENIVNIYLKENKPDALVKDLAEMPEVQGISRSLIITSVGNYWGSMMKYKDPQDSGFVYYNGIDEKYLALHDVKLIAGRNFTPKNEKDEESEVIVNEGVLKRFNIGNNDPLNAIDEMVIVDKKPMKIIGVMKDFHYGKADSEVSEVIFRYARDNAQFLNVKVVSADWPATLAKIEKAWKKIDDVHPLEAEFYRDRIVRSYADISAMIKIVGFLAFLAICIASMGLLGMVVYTTETRIKEISIRKVLGASERNLILLLSRGFLVLLLIAAAIATPVSYLFFEKVVLPEMPNHAPVTVGQLLIGLFAVGSVAFLLIGSQTLKVARSNPSEVLKNE